MCQSQTTFWKCHHLAAGNFHLCSKYSSTAGRECDGYTSFARVMKRPCPKCSRRAATKPPPPSSSTSDQATAGAEELTEEMKLERERRRRVNAWVPGRRTKRGKVSVVNRFLESKEAVGEGAGEDTQAGKEEIEEGE